MKLYWDNKALEGEETFSSLVAPPPAPAEESLGCISRTVRNRFSEVVVRKPISAFGWRPYKYGLSGGRLSSMYAW